MTQEEEFIKLFKDIFNSKQVSKEIGKWQISNLNSPHIIEMWFDDGEAIYGFNLEVSGKSITLENYHREAVRGVGTISLKSLESIFKSIGRWFNKTIILIFPPGGQEDTIAWLKKNNYSLEEGEYVKIL